MCYEWVSGYVCVWSEECLDLMLGGGSSALIWLRLSCPLLSEWGPKGHGRKSPKGQGRKSPKAQGRKSPKGQEKKSPKGQERKSPKGQGKKTRVRASLCSTIFYLKVSTCLVLSSLYTLDFYYINYVPYLTLWLPSLFCALLLSCGFVFLCFGFLCFSCWNILLFFPDDTHLCVPRLTLPFTIHQHPHNYTLFPI